MKKGPSEYSRANPFYFKKAPESLLAFLSLLPVFLVTWKKKRDSVGVCLMTHKCPARNCFLSELPDAKIKSL